MLRSPSKPKQSTTEKLLSLFSQPEIEPVLPLPLASTDTWLSSLSRSIGWINPFKSRKQQGVALTSLLIMQTFSIVSAAFCFTSARGVDYGLTCSGSETEEGLFKLLQSACGAYIAWNQHSSKQQCIGDIFIIDLTHWVGKSSADFGRSFFGNPICTLQEYYSMDDTCLHTVLNNNIKNGQLTKIEGALTAIGAIGALIALAGLGYCVIGCLRQRKSASDLEAGQATEHTPLQPT